VLAVRRHYIRRLLPNVELLRIGVRAAVPVAGAAALVGVVRIAWSGPRTVAEALLELTIFLAATALLTWLSERSLVRELLRQLRAGRLRQGVATVPAPSAQ